MNTKSPVYIFAMKFYFFPLVGVSTTRNNSKVLGNNISLLVDTVHSLQVAQEFHFQKLDQVIEKARNLLIHIFFFLFCPPAGYN